MDNPNICTECPKITHRNPRLSYHEFLHIWIAYGCWRRADQTARYHFSVHVCFVFLILRFLVFCNFEKGEVNFLKGEGRWRQLRKTHVRMVSRISERRGGVLLSIISPLGSFFVDISISGTRFFDTILTFCIEPWEVTGPLGGALWSTEGNFHQDVGWRFNHSFDICLVVPRSIQEPPATISADFGNSGESRHVMQARLGPGWHPQPLLKTVFRAQGVRSNKIGGEAGKARAGTPATHDNAFSVVLEKIQRHLGCLAAE